MHELSIAQSLVGQARKVCQEQQARRVTALALRVGTLSGVDPEALKMAFPLAAEDSVAAGAALSIETIEADVTCAACGAASEPEPPFLYCAACGSRDVQIRKGRELYVHSMEVEFEETGETVVGSC